MADYLTFGDLISKGETLISQFKSSISGVMKDVINMVYWEILGCDENLPLHWMLKLVDDVGAVDSADISDTGITEATPPVVTATAHGLVTGDIVSIYDAGGMVEVNNRIFHFTKVNANSGNLQNLDKTDIVGADYTTHTTGGKLVHRGITLSDKARHIISAGFSDQVPMVFLDWIKAEKDTALWANAESRPIKCTHRQSLKPSDGSSIDQLIWFPGCDDDYSLRIWIEKRPDLLESNSDLILIPQAFQHGMLAGVATRLAEFDVQVENAVVWPKIYEWHINNIRAFNRRWWKKHEGTGADNKPFLL